MLLYFGLALFCLGIYLLLSKKTVAPYFPTKKKDLPRINDLIELKDGQVFYDLGCGDGRVCHYLAKSNSKAVVVGFETSMIFYLISLIRKKFSGLQNLQVKRKDIFDLDLAEADVIYFFGLKDSTTNALKEKIEQSAKRGAKIISYAFSIDGWQNEALLPENKSDIKIFVYKIK